MLIGVLDAGGAFVMPKFAVLYEQLRRGFAELEATRKRLREARQAVKAANEAERRLLVDLSHELHTPLPAILGYADLYLSEHGDPAPPQSEEEESASDGIRGPEDLGLTPSEWVTMRAGFLEGLPQRLERIERGLRDADRTLLLDTTHTLAGTAGLLGFARLRRWAKWLEQQAQTETEFQSLRAAQDAIGLDDYR